MYKASLQNWKDRESDNDRRTNQQGTSAPNNSLDDQRQAIWDFVRQLPLGTSAEECELDEIISGMHGIEDLRNKLDIFSSNLVSKYKQTKINRKFKFYQSKAESKRALGKSQFAFVEKLYSSDRGAVASLVLSEDWRKCVEREQKHEGSRFFKHWKDQFECVKEPDGRPYVAKNQVATHLVLPISLDEVKREQSAFSISAAGPVGVSAASARCFN